MVLTGQLHGARSAPVIETRLDRAGALAVSIRCAPDSPCTETLRLPTHATYRIAQEVTSGHVKVAIPQAASATHAVTAHIHSGELELLPS